MTDHFTAFDDETRIATGPLAEVALAVKRAARDANASAILIFDDRTGRTIDLDVRGSDAEIVGRVPQGPEAPAGAASAARRGRGPDRGKRRRKRPARGR